MAACPQCGTRILPGALACINCQRPIDAATAAAAAHEGDAPVGPPPYAPPPQTSPQPPPPPYAAASYPPPPPPPFGGPPPEYVGPVPYSPGYYPQGPAPWSTNGMSIASLILAILWLGGIGSLLGVIFGHVGRGQIKKRPQRGGGIATAGLIIGYVGLIASVTFWASLPRIFHSGFVQDILVKDDIHNAADAEDSYHHEYNTFTTDASSLRIAGFDPSGRNTIAVATSDGLGFCIVGARDGGNDWYLYDTSNGGLNEAQTYPSQAEAEASCVVSGIGSYAVVN